MTEVTMQLKTQLLAITFALAGLAPMAAQADHQFEGRFERRHQHDQHCDHSGGYAVRTVSRWVEGRYEQVWVPPTCHHRPFRHRKVCRGGYYEQQFRPGHYENVEERVWVDEPQRHRPVSWPVDGRWVASARAGSVGFQLSGAY
jgi:hypothetical protein